MNGRTPNRRDRREAGLDASPWAEQVVRRGQPRERAERRLGAVARAQECNHPTGDIGEMLGDIERGRSSYLVLGDVAEAGRMPELGKTGS